MRLYLTYVFFIFLLIQWACSSQKGSVENIEFENPYRFSTEIEEKVEQDTLPWKYQISASEYASKGDYLNALIHWELATGKSESSYSTSEVDSINRMYQKVPAKDYIIAKAKLHVVVIINEAHHNSLHRYFTKTLLQGLYDVGYRNLGLEALGNGQYEDSRLMERGYPTQATGFYTKDPQFGNLIREAIAIGYHVFPYEVTGGENGKEREIGQARNIQQMMEARPGEKFLIHCGFDHSLEGDHGSWEKAMAGRLSEYTGVDPLTINQVQYSEKSESKYNHRFLKALDVKESTVILNENEEPFKYTRGSAFTDIAVFHPNTNYIEGRPQWLFENRNQLVPLDLAGIDVTYPVMLHAYPLGDDIHKAVPVDVYEVEKENEHPTLSLKKGQYIIVASCKDVNTLKWELKVH